MKSIYLNHSVQKLSVLLILLFCLNTELSAQKGKELEYKVKAITSIREIAKETTGEPDLWEMILRYNNLTSPVEVVTGLILKIPVENVKKTRKAIDDAVKIIQFATDEGAKVLAQDEISKASSSLNDALEKRKQTQWQACIEAAATAQAFAQKALQLTREKRTVNGSAVLAYKKGSVENKKSNDNNWKISDLLASFVENERVRTLASSLAEIQFQDNSKIKLNENSQVTIQQNKVDLLKSKSESTVKIEKGDAFALLGGNSAKKKFKVAIPGVESNIKSKSFWVNRDNNSTKLANYDGEIELTSKNGSKVSIKENQGSTISDNGNITKPKDLLKSPIPVFPGDGDTLLTADYSFAWEVVPGATKYWVVIATDNIFKKVIFSDKSISGTQLKTKLEAGYYFWRVAAVDKDGFPGPFSDKREALLSLDTKPPYLMINSPAEGALFADASLTVSGEAEVGAILTVQGVLSIADGKPFTAAVSLSAGANLITISAKDKAGNISEIKRTVFYNSGTSAPLYFDTSLIRTETNTFIAPNTPYKLRGRTIPRSELTFTSENSVLLSTVSDSVGFFAVDLQLNNGTNRFGISITDAYRKSYKDQCTVELDTLTPLIEFEEFPEVLTKEKSVIFSGTLQNVTQFLLNDQLVESAGKKFRLEKTLIEGDNKFVFRIKRRNGKEILLNRSVQCDASAPVLMSAKPLTPRVGKDKRVELIILVEDRSELSRSMRVVYKSGEEITNGIASLVDGKKEYRLVSNAGADVGKSVIILSVITEDVLGNVKEYVITPDEK